jgi:hypothetical protein
MAVRDSAYTIRVETLTGLELQLFERAGYLVRRGAFDTVAPPTTIPPVIVSLCRDILGESFEEECVGAESRGWMRSSGSSYDAGEQELVLRQTEIQAVVVTGGDAVFCVIPGSHLERLSQELVDILKRNAAVNLPDQVCLTLQPGDAALFSSTLLHRWLKETGAGTVALWCVKRLRGTLC